MTTANATDGNAATGSEKAAGARYLKKFSQLHKFERAQIDARRTMRKGRVPPKGALESELEIVSDYTGLALSGGGVRSAATCLGAIQALHAHHRLDQFDYLSTVSGGGYIGACLSAALSKTGGGQYPFGDDISDSPAVSHLRDYSNYLMPRSQSRVINLANGGLIILRGLIANAICVLTLLLPVALFCGWLFKYWHGGGFVAFAVEGLTERGWWLLLLSYVAFDLFVIVVVLLALWAALRGFPSLDRHTSDTSSRLLSIARVLLFSSLAFLVLELQPAAADRVDEALGFLSVGVDVIAAAAASTVGMIAAFASTLGNFLKHSERKSGLFLTARRILASALLYLGAAIVPLMLWLTYLVLTDQLIKHPEFFGPVFLIYVLCFILIWFMRANGYSLHSFYRDRLSKAFILRRATTAAENDKLLNIKLSDLRDSDGPYPLINAALNIQGSLKANQRGREADFFVFTPDYIGSPLTGFAPTVGEDAYESFDRRIDLAGAMAISGAAVSANMGSNTVRVLSPTLSLLNIRLGYWIRNPRFLTKAATLWERLRSKMYDRAFLVIEILNRTHEGRRHLYVSDGGHIENLGIYQLLQRRCGLIFAIDAEADPSWGCSSLLKLERYARIDLGVRIELPWEQIAARSIATSRQIQDGDVECHHGPHCAVGSITYPDDGDERIPNTPKKGVLIYVKSSLTGDEKDYLIDYARRHPSFPHESTSDQFFSEEQFEMYRALGFHMVNRFFNGDAVATFSEPNGQEPDTGALRHLVEALLPKRPQAADPAAAATAGGGEAQAPPSEPANAPRPAAN